MRQTEVAHETTVVAAAARLREAAQSGIPVAPVRNLIGGDAEAAYAVQRLNAAARVADGATVVGRKIGLTSAAVQQQLGVNQPDFGILFDDMAYTSGDAIASNAVLQPRAEAEIAFVLKDELVDGDLDYDQVKDAIDYAVVAVEVCGSRIINWDISFGDTVADNASAGAFVLGSHARTLADFDTVSAEMAMSINGVEVSTGSGAACMGDPINAVAWLARTARDLGDPLRAGQIVLSGALGRMRAIEPGNTVTANVSGLGSVTFTIGEQR